MNYKIIKTSAEFEVVKFLANNMKETYFSNLNKCEVIFAMYIQDAVEIAKNSEHKVFILPKNQTQSGNPEFFQLKETIE